MCKNLIVLDVYNALRFLIQPGTRTTLSRIYYTDGNLEVDSNPFYKYRSGYYVTCRILFSSAVW